MGCCLEHRSEGGGRAVLQLGGRRRRRALRQNGPQRNRVRGHAAHVRGLPHHEDLARLGQHRHEQRQATFKPFSSIRSLPYESMSRFYLMFVCGMHSLGHLPF